MATQTEQISASQQRQRIPTEWQIEFLTWKNSSLLSLSQDATAQHEVKAYAGWELDYRIAFGILVDDPPNPTPLVDRSRWTLEGARATIRRQMEESA